jgi:hypothetical protein
MEIATGVAGFSWWIARTIIQSWKPYHGAVDGQKVYKKSETDFNSTQHHVVIPLLYKVYSFPLFIVSSKAQKAFCNHVHDA